MGEYIVPRFQSLVDNFKLLPGVGERTAQRFAHFVMSLPESSVAGFAKSLLDAKKCVKLCSVCKNFTEDAVCSICRSEKRDASTICVVEYPGDVAFVEKTISANFLYHVLHGAVSPMEGRGPGDIYIKELLSRINKRNVIKEVILATSSTVTGETTAIYIKNLILPLGLKVTRLACGIPAGISLDYVDDVTLKSAFINRVEM